MMYLRPASWPTLLLEAKPTELNLKGKRGGNKVCASKLSVLSVILTYLIIYCRRECMVLNTQMEIRLAAKRLKQRKRSLANHKAAVHRSQLFNQDYVLTSCKKKKKKRSFTPVGKSNR